MLPSSLGYANMANSGNSTVPKSGISRGVPPPSRHRRLIENARLTPKLNGNDSSHLQISNRERMAVSRRTFLLSPSLEPQAPSLQTLIANADAPCIGILSDQRESKGFSYRSSLSSAPPTFATSNRKSGIRIPPNGLQNQPHAIF